MQTLYIPLENGPQLGPTVSGCSKHWLILHSIVCTAIYSSHDFNTMKMADQAWIPEV